MNDGGAVLQLYPKVFGIDVPTLGKDDSRVVYGEHLHLGGDQVADGVVFQVHKCRVVRVYDGALTCRNVAALAGVDDSRALCYDRDPVQRADLCGSLRYHVEAF